MLRHPQFLEDLVTGNADVLAAIHVSSEGLVLGTSPGVGRDEADHWAAVMAALQAVSNRGAEIIGHRAAEAGPWGHSAVEVRSGCTLILVGACGNSMLAVVCGKAAQLGGIGAQLIELADSTLMTAAAA
ncbi:roadblock/LC7 domain-containing protein [Kitasatospora sp. NPDC004799]|uniref:roadblock/LC7 domain-containing protein n=1 Tax=Kitasatospora sp. NPDC004799 TaxID=3154460 RepID=UPI0033B2C90D